jgi:3-oxoacyl-[acyl-carrier protein] reductase
MDLGLDGRVYIVTGASRGLGRATAEALVAEGAKVVVTGRDPATISAAAAQIAALGPAPGGALGVAADNADPDAGERLVAAAMARYERLDGALVSVGGPVPGPALSLSEGQWTEAFSTVFLGALRVARAVVEGLGPDGGSLAFVLSSSVREPILGLGASNGLRPGLAMVAKELASELGPRGIRVNGLVPGRIGTERLRQLDAGRKAADLASTRRSIPLGRDGLPAEFGRVAAFVLSPAASYLTGVMLAVDGGMLKAL